MSFTRPTLQQIIDRIASDFVAKITGSTTLALRSVLLIMARAYAGAVHGLYGYLDNQSKELFITTATGNDVGGQLDTHGTEFGVLRNIPTYATGSITCSGTVGINIPAGSALTSPSGNRYTTNALAVIGGGGTVLVAVTCDTAGSVGNDSAGVVLVFSSPIVNVNSSTTVDANGLAGGSDMETDDAYRVRLLARKQNAPHGGSSADLIAWMKEVDGVTRAWTSNSYMGAGTVLCAFVMDAQSPITPNSTQVSDMVNYLTSHVGTDGQAYGVPVTMLPAMFVAAPLLHSVDMSIAITPNTSDVQWAVTNAMIDYLYADGNMGSTLYRSQMSQAISGATGLTAHTIITPASDVVLAYNQIAVLGSITWSTY